jgi:hypothetical protein
MREYVRALCGDPDYVPPTRRQVLSDLTGELFRQEYRGIKQKLEMCGWIDIVLEQIHGEGIGVWVVAGGAVYFWAILEGGVEAVAEGVFKNVEAMLSHRTMGVCWGRWNAVVIGDTADPLVAGVLQCVKADTKTAHVWFLPCVGRGASSLMRELLEVEGFEGTWEGAGMVARALRERAGGVQWELLRECQRKCYGESRWVHSISARTKGLMIPDAFYYRTWNNGELIGSSPVACGEIEKLCNPGLCIQGRKYLQRSNS